MKLLRSRLKDPSLESQLEKDLVSDDFYKLLDADNGLTESWEALQKAGRNDLKLAKEALEKVRDLLSDAKVQKALGANYADELSAICKAQGGFSGAKSLVAHLEDVKTFCNKFDDKEGFDQVVASMKNSNGNVQDGLQHVLNQVNKVDFDASKVSKFDMEFEGEGLPCTKCKFDVQLTEGNKPRLIEYKSYLDASKIQLPQFLNYIASVNDLSEMKYVFNAAKLSTEQAKVGMRMFMSINKNKQDIFSTIWSNEGLKNSIFPSITDQNQAYTKFGDMLNDNDSPIFNFIESK